MKTKTITIPKEQFESIFFQNGGVKQADEENYKTLTGEYIFEEQNEEVANAEIEKGEYIFDSQGIRKAGGDTHENGGTKVLLEEGTKILSDHLKPSAKDVKKINDLYDLGAKTTDTYAKIVDKYNRKSGLDKINKELEEYIAKLAKQNKDVKDETTLALNTQYLSGEINEEFKEKEPLEKEREEIFNSLFEIQEASKAKENESKNFQVGGQMTYNGDTIIEIGRKYGVTPERAKELLANYKRGGEVLPEYQNGAIVTVQPEPTDRGNIYSPFNPNNPLFYGVVPQPVENQRVANIFEKDKYGHQKPNRNWKDFGELNKTKQTDVIRDIARVFPSLADKFLKNGVPTNPNEFQKAVNEHYDSLKEDAKKMYPEGSKELETFLQSVDKERFSIPTGVKDIKGLVTDIDNKFGDYTSTRPNFSFSVLPKDILIEVKNSGVNTASELKQVFPEYYKKYVEPKGLESDFWLDIQDAPTPTTTPPVNTPQVEQTPTVAPTAEDPAKKVENRGLFLTPDMTPLSPSSQVAHLSVNRRFPRVEPVYVSPEQQLKEIDRSRQQAYRNINMLPDQQKAAAISTVSANTEDSISKVLGDVTKYNAQAKERSVLQNAQIGQAEENAAWQDALNYERNTYLAKDKTEQDWRNFYNKLNENQLNDWKAVEMLNRYNALNPDVQFTGQGYEVSKPTFANNPAVNRMLASADTPTENLPKPKKKAKRGGRFKS